MRSSGAASAGRGWTVACGLLLIAALSAFCTRPERVVDVGTVVKHFYVSTLDARCGVDGRPADAGFPCGDSRGYRFVLRPQGAFDIYRDLDGRRVVSSSGEGVIWSGDTAVDRALTDAFERDSQSP